MQKIVQSMAIRLAFQPRSTPESQSLQSHAEASKIAEVALVGSGTPHSDAARDRAMRRRARRTAAGKG